MTNMLFFEALEAKLQAIMPFQNQIAQKHNQKEQ